MGFILKKMKHFIILLAVSSLSSCLIQIVRGNYYEELETQQKNKIRKLDSFEQLDSSYIYEITGPQLIEQLESIDSALVYIFNNGCNSENCLPLSTIEDYAKKKGYDLFMITDSYYQIDETLSQAYSGQLFAINADYYGNPNSNRYIKDFKADIGYDDFLNEKDEKFLGLYLFYDGSELVDIQETILED